MKNVIQYPLNTMPFPKNVITGERKKADEPLVEKAKGSSEGNHPKNDSQPKVPVKIKKAPILMGSTRAAGLL
ncbi:hypothetical protein HK101_004226 [Irineochytrium annulatum]|nr:hypothetical protein HK101_004226 [Irineochytrium annulatum]